jgi:alpha-beta hydrolase superfamily lysophospholipase
LPGYYLEHDRKRRPTVLMIGGGDTFREDLFYFAGYPGWKRGYNVLMVDLPGQGNTPADGWHFQVDADRSISACLDWLEAHAAAPSDQCAVYGVSGGGYFTAQAVASDPRIGAWVASTPITDIGLLFEREIGAALRAPSWLLQLATRITSSVSKNADISLRKYAWQFGTTDFKEAFQRVRAEALRVSPDSITCPALFLVGDGEAAELKRQTTELHDELARLGRDVTVRQFKVYDGADAHCQLNNLRLAHLVVFDWLDKVFANGPALDPRVPC